MPVSTDRRSAISMQTRHRLDETIDRIEVVRRWSVIDLLFECTSRRGELHSARAGEEASGCSSTRSATTASAARISGTAHRSAMGWKLAFGGY